MNKIMNDKEMDLSSPIFALYINVDGMSRQRAEEQVGEFIDNFFTFNNVTVLYFPVKGVQETRIECVWKGSFEAEGNIEHMSKKFSSESDFGKHIMKDKNLTDDEKSKFSQQLRKYKLKNLSDGKPL